MCSTRFGSSWCAHTITIPMYVDVVVFASCTRCALSPKKRSLLLFFIIIIIIAQWAWNVIRARHFVLCFDVYISIFIIFIYIFGSKRTAQIWKLCYMRACGFVFIFMLVVVVVMFCVWPFHSPFNMVIHSMLHTYILYYYIYIIITIIIITLWFWSMDLYRYFSIHLCESGKKQFFFHICLHSSMMVKANQIPFLKCIFLHKLQ